MNWILGHIVTNRSHVLETVGAAHAWQEGVRTLYHTETPPVTPGSESVQFETLIVYLDESVAWLKSALEDVSEERLEEVHSNYRGEKTRYAHVKSFHWHESFHLGQLEILKAFIEFKAVNIFTFVGTRSGVRWKRSRPLKAACKPPLLVTNPSG